MKKKLMLIVVAILIIACATCLAACDTSTDTQNEESALIEDSGETAVTAYEIAVKHGFIGTEEDWLASLKGEASDITFTIEDLYDAAVASGFSGDFMAFIKEYVSTDSTVDSTYAVSKAILSAVVVKAKFRVASNTWGWRTEERDATSGGAGVIYKLDKTNGDAYIITNFHIVYEATSTTEDHLSDDVNVYLYGSEYSAMAIPAAVVGGSAYYDIAVLKVTGSDVLKNSDAREVTLSDGEITVGQTATAIGYPAAEGMSVSSGIVSVDSESITVAVDGTNGYAIRVMRVDAAINSGNSGGGVFNSDGELIGIVNARYNSTTIENIGYAIPVTVAIAAADNIIYNDNGTTRIAVYKCMMGVTTSAISSKMVYDESTGKTSIEEVVKIAEITAGGLAEGKLEVGDIINTITLNGKTYIITRNYMIGDIALTARVGDEITVAYTRDGVAGTVNMTFTGESVTVYYTK